MKCYNHSENDAIGLCLKCGKGVCKECLSENISKEVICKSCYRLLSETTTQPAPQPIIIKTRKDDTILNIGFLAIALGIDFFDLLPLDLIGIGYAYELPLAGIEALFLNTIGVPPIKNVLETGWDLVPIIDAMPWCTLAVLDKKFNVKLPLLTQLFN